MNSVIEIDNTILTELLTNPDKIFFPEAQLTKKDILTYYYLMADYILPYLRNRPMVLKRYPNGISGHSFYQKEIPAYAPAWLKSVAIYHEEAHKEVNYIAIDDPRSLLWVVNQGAIELHAWLSQVGKIDFPDLIIIDLDPEPPATFKDCLVVASLVRELLLKLGLDAWPKTSGATGMHLFIPVKPIYSFQETTEAAKALLKVILEVYPEKTTMQHIIANRTGKVYLDYLQNARGRSMAFPFSIRPFPQATVSMPLSWEEVKQQKVTPGDFTAKNAWTRVQQKGDFMQDMLKKNYELDSLFTLRASQRTS